MITDILIIVLFVFINWILFKKDTKKVLNKWKEVFYRGLIPIVLSAIVIYFFESYVILLILPITLILEYMFFSSELVLDRDLANTLGVKLVILNFANFEPSYNTVRLYINTSEGNYEIKSILNTNIDRMRRRISSEKLNEFNRRLEFYNLQKEGLELSDKTKIDEINKKLEELNNPINQIPTKLKQIKKMIKLLENTKQKILLGKEKEEKLLEYTNKIEVLNIQIQGELEKLKENEHYKQSIQELEEYVKLIDSLSDFYLITFYMCWNDFVKDELPTFVKVYLLRRKFSELERILKEVFKKDVNLNIIPSVLSLNCTQLLDEKLNGRKITSVIGFEGERNEKMLKELKLLSYSFEKIKIIHKDYEFEILENENKVLKDMIDDIKQKHKELKDYKEGIKAEMEGED